MPDTGWISGSVVAQLADGFPTWSNASGAISDNNDTASNAAAAGSVTETLYIYGFNFNAITNGSTPTKIEVQVKAANNTGGNAYVEGALHDSSGTSTIYALTPALTGSTPAYYDDAASDNWGNAAWLTLSRIKAGTFGVYLRVNGSTGSGTIAVDNVRMRITYDLPRTDAVGDLPAATATPPVATVVGKANVSGSIPGATASPPEATASGAANASGTIPGATATPPLAPTSVAAEGSIPGATATPPAATVSGSANVSGDLPSASATPPEGTARNRLITPPERIITVAGNRVTDRTITVGTNRVADRTINVS